ncbi:Endocuticle structural glycoprotein SgAbd-1 [Trachymyrmex septentrionalis]|uniref:Endocuticle structural glycoprotein SgAbd-1 n=1 Tax=Trachymyrmex septentrionalis TaxID=34720 RepID=A0A195FPH7_9HYME|nr:Endocuticle structural glycoprotein SgAbd-1 [Trachymyrmex septentrionalis]
MTPFTAPRWHRRVYKEPKRLSSSSSRCPCDREIMYTIKVGPSGEKRVLVAVVLCTTGTLSAPQRGPVGGSEKDAVITSQQLEVGFDGNYVNNFETSNGISHQERGEPKQVEQETPVVSQGSDQYVAPDGQQVHINWIADENGFQVQGSHIPTAPPIPPEIQRALEWNAAHPEEDDGGQRPPGRGENRRIVK